MATSRSHQHATRNNVRPPKPMEDPKEITHDLVEYVTDYARRNPGYAALYCVGVGFLLGWKLKPW